MGRLSKGWEGLELEPLCSSHRAAIRATLLVTFFCAWVHSAVVVNFELLWLVSADAARSLNVVNRTSPLGLFPTNDPHCYKVSNH